MTSQSIVGSDDINLVRSIPQDGHDHMHNNNLPKKSLAIVLIITFAFMIVEVLVGYAINSLALIADAGHMANDVLSILLALIAISISQIKKSSRFTFGFRRVEVFSGLINGFSLLGIAGYIIFEAVDRYDSSSYFKINGLLLIITASLGLLVNIIGMYILKESSKDNINVEAAYHHVIADLLGSIAAIVAGIFIILWNVYWMDLVVSVIISILILKSGISITQRTIKILLEATPHGVDSETILADLLTIEGVIDVHDLHVWTITSGQNMITGHITILTGTDIDLLLSKIKQYVLINHQVHHPTFQVEFTPCEGELDCFPKTTNEVNIISTKG